MFCSTCLFMLSLCGQYIVMNVANSFDLHISFFLFLAITGASTSRVVWQTKDSNVEKGILTCNRSHSGPQKCPTVRKVFTALHLCPVVHKFVFLLLHFANSHNSPNTFQKYHTVQSKHVVNPIIKGLLAFNNWAYTMLHTQSKSNLYTAATHSPRFLKKCLLSFHMQRKNKRL